MDERIAADPLGADRRDDLVEPMLLERGLVGDIVASQRHKIVLAEATEVGGDAAKAQACARVYGARERQRFVGHDALARDAGVDPQVDIQRAGGRPEESLRLVDPLEAVGGRLEIVVHELGDVGGLGHVEDHDRGCNPGIAQRDPVLEIGHREIVNPGGAGHGVGKPGRWLAIF